MSKDKLVEHEKFGGKLWLLFSGDKGGNHTNFLVEIVNSAIAGSVDNVHIYCMFEATDCIDNTWKLWLPFREEIKGMQKDGFQINGKEVKIFLGGDYHYLDDNLGHQGSSATFPSLMDKTTLSHLQKHGGHPHTPNHCYAEKRTVASYLKNYKENLIGHRNDGNMRKMGPSISA